MPNLNIFQSGGKKVLIAVLIAANFIMLLIGVLTIPPNLKAVMSGKVPTLKVAQSEPSATAAPATADRVENTPAPVNLSTTARPNLQDFLWYTEDVLYNGAPGNAASITGFDTLTGGWKAFIIYDPEGTHNSSATEFLNIALEGTAENVSLTLDWYQIFWGNEGESFDETDMEDTVFRGQWEKGGLWASGSGTIRLEQFYSFNNKQYAIGTMDTPNGIPAFIALVRP